MDQPGLSRRGEELLEEAARRSRATVRSRLGGLRPTVVPIGQTALSAGGAWLVATEVFGHEQPFFAPIAAIIALGVNFAQRGRRAVELVLGVALGILVADALILAIGTGTAQLSLVVALAMAAAVLLGGGPVFITQAAVSAVLVATLQPPTEGLSGARFVDALAGGAVGLAVSALVFPLDPVAAARRAAKPLIEELASTLGDVAQALRARDTAAAERALARARAIEAPTGAFRDALAAAVETARYAPPRWRSRTRLAPYVGAEPQLDLAVRDVRVLARGAIRALALQDAVPDDLPAALLDLCAAVRGLGAELDDPTGGEAARTAALRAAGRATLVLERTGNLSVSVLVGQVRATATDLLRGLGMERDEALAAVRAAAGTIEREQLDGA